MATNLRRRLIIFFAGTGLTLIFAGMLPLIAAAQDATPTLIPQADATPGPGTLLYNLEEAPAVEPTGNNSYCVLCHNQPLQTVVLQDGNILNLYVNPDLIANSVHGMGSEGGPLGCVDCHGTESFPHSGPTPTDQRAYSIESVKFCIGCHTDEVQDLQHGLHEQAILTGNTQAAVCTDCHGAHDIQPVEEFPELVAGVCGDCHENTLVEWQSSAHVDIGPLDCATCHSPHSQQMRVGDSTTALCLNCHEEMPAIFVHQQHPSDQYPIECVDCHMFVPEPEGDVVNISTLGTPMSTGHTVQVETVSCNTCHEQLVSTGEWEQLRGIPVAAGGSEASLATVPTEEHEAAAPPTSYIQLIQGLILGIGFGITAAAVFIARGNRRPAHSEEHGE